MFGFGFCRLGFIVNRLRDEIIELIYLLLPVAFVLDRLEHAAILRSIIGYAADGIF